MKTKGFRWRQLFAAALLMLSAGYMGYAWRSLIGVERPDKQRKEEIASFSEVARAKGNLRRVSGELIAALQMQRLKNASARGMEDHEKAGRLLESIEEFTEARQELVGTPYESVLLHKLLDLLRDADQQERWLDLYLSFLYEHPMDELVGRLADDAVVIARRTNREPQLMKALQFVGTIPLTFATQRQVETALNSIAAAPTQTAPPQAGPKS